MAAPLGHRDATQRSALSLLKPAMGVRFDPVAVKRAREPVATLVEESLEIEEEEGADEAEEEVSEEARKDTEADEEVTQAAKRPRTAGKK